MDYKEKYKMAFERARKNYDVAQDLCNGSQIGVECFKNTLTNIFPELAESEDERIREALVKFHKSTIDVDGIKGEDILAWLEKQGKKVIPKNIDEAALQYVDTCTVDGEVTHDNITEPYWNNHSMMNAYKAGWLEKQGEQEILCDKCKKEQPSHSCQDMKTLMTLDEAIEHCNEKSCDDTACSKNHKQLAEWLTELKGYRNSFAQEAQKPANNVEPKFKVGDWVVDNHGEVNQVASVTDDGYGFALYDGTYVSGCWKDYYHLWTIKDAKDGDVLVSTWKGCSYIYIFKEVENNIIISHIYYYPKLDGIDMGVINMDNTPTIPATKEQRDLLFQKMKEAGYEWDVENKELKKIEQEDEEYNGDDYGIDSLYHAQRILEKTLGEVEGYQSDDGILEHKCAITAVKELYKKKPAEWSEEDEKHIDSLLKRLEGLCRNEFERTRFAINEDQDWLNQLKERIKN